MEIDTYYTVPEAARRLSLDPQTLYRWCRIGHLRAVRIGRRLRLPSAELQKLIHEGDEENKSGDAA